MVASLEVLLSEGILDEVVSQLKSGKEADVFLVRHAGDVVAAKVYKQRDQRSFKNNAEYKEGRSVRNSRTQRAIERGSRFGRAAEEEAWKSVEADALFKLHAQGVRVPRPVLFYEGVLLMELVLDAEGRPARRLIDAPITGELAAALYRDLRGQAIKMLCSDLIHGDLSAYNVLLGAAGPTVIDLPQVVAAAANSRSEHFFTRDLENLRRFFARFDSSLEASRGDSSEIWHAYVRRELFPEFVPSGRPPAQPHHRPGKQAGGAHPPGGRPQGGGRPHESAPRPPNAKPQRGRGGEARRHGAGPTPGVVVSHRPSLPGGGPPAHKGRPGQSRDNPRRRRWR
jgi:RIO kinase 1